MSRRRPREEDGDEGQDRESDWELADVDSPHVTQGRGSSARRGGRQRGDPPAFDPSFASAGGAPPPLLGGEGRGGRSRFARGRGGVDHDNPAKTLFMSDGEAAAAADEAPKLDCHALMLELQNDIRCEQEANRALLVDTQKQLRNLLPELDRDAWMFERRC